MLGRSFLGFAVLVVIPVLSLPILGIPQFSLAEEAPSVKKQNQLTVKGMVKLDGQPLNSGRIVFVPLKPDPNGPVHAAPIQNGEYELAQPTFGTKRIEIYSVVDPDDENQIEIIPEQYNRKSTVKLKLISGNYRFDFNLKSK